MRTLAEWRRPFRVWHYTVSYSQLLLRSVNAKGVDTRIDVLFSNVKMMHLAPSMQHLTITEAAAEEVNPSAIALPKNFEHGKIFLLNGGESYLCATHCEWHEDEGGTRSPSFFGPLKGLE